MTQRYRDAEHEPREYVREEAVQRSQELSPVDTNQESSDFRLMFYKVKQEAKKEKKDVIKISQKPILKQRLVHLYVSGYYNTRQIARILMVSEHATRKLLRSDEVQAMIRQYQDVEKDIIDESLKALRMKAIDTQRELLDSDNEVVRANVSKDILDRTGHKAKEEKKIDINVSYEERLNALVQGAVIEDVSYIVNESDTQISNEGADNGDDE